jgi:hypothetical protein
MQTFHITDIDYNKTFSLQWDNPEPPTDDEIDEILNEARKGYEKPPKSQPEPQIQPPIEQPSTTPTSFADIAGQLKKAPEQPTPERAGAGMFQTAIPSSTRVPEGKLAGTEQISQALESAVPYSSKPIQQQVRTEYEEPSLTGIPKELADTLPIKGAKPLSVKWWEKLDKERKSDLEGYLSDKDRALIEGFNQNKLQAWGSTHLKEVTFGLAGSERRKVMAALKHPGMNIIGGLTGTLYPLIGIGATAKLIVSLPKIISKAKTYGKVGEIIAHAATGSMTLATDALIRNREDLASGDEERIRKANEAIASAATFGAVAVAPSIAKISAALNGLTQGSLVALFSYAESPEAFNKENIAHTAASIITMGVMGYVGGRQPLKIKKEAAPIPVEGKPVETPATPTEEVPNVQQVRQEKAEAQIVPQQAPEIPGPAKNILGPVEELQKNVADIQKTIKETERISKQRLPSGQEINQEMWRRGIAKELRKKILAQPKGKEQWDYINGRKIKDNKGELIHYTEKSKAALENIYDYYETTEGKNKALKWLGTTKNPFEDFEDVASVLQKGERIENKAPYGSPEYFDQMSKKELKEYEEYMRKMDEEAGQEAQRLGDGTVLYSKKLVKQTDLLGGEEKTPEQLQAEEKARYEREEVKRRLAETPKLSGGAIDPNAPMWKGTKAIEGEQMAMFSKAGAINGKYTKERLNSYYKNAGLGKLIEAVDDFPENISSAIKSRGYETEGINAAYDPVTQKIYVHSRGIENKADILRTARHELTHLGLRITLKDRINPIYESIYKKYKNTEVGKNVIDNYFENGIDEKNHLSRMQFADEVLAKLGESNIDPGYFRAIVSRIKQILIKKFPGIKFTDADVRAMIIRGQREAVKYGKEIEKKGEVAFNKEQKPLSEEEGKKIALKLGVEYQAIQTGFKNLPDRYQFEDPETGSSFLGRTFEESKALRNKYRTKFREAKPQEPLTEEEGKNIAKELGVQYKGITEKVGELPEKYSFQDGKGGGGFEAGSLREAEARLRMSRERLKEPGKQTETPEFKKWFGDSKVVDKNGNPKIVYHSTNAEWNIFDSKKTLSSFGFHAGTKEQAEEVRFTGGTKEDVNKIRPTEGMNIKPVYLNIKNPIRMEDKGTWYPFEMIEELSEKGIKNNETLPKNAKEYWIGSLNYLDLTWDKYSEARKKLEYYLKRHIEQWLEKHPDKNRDQVQDEGRLFSRDYVKRLLKEHGYDGIVYDNKIEGGGDSYIAFEPNQIKSAIGNRGAFSEENPDIRFSKKEKSLMKTIEENKKLREAAQGAHRVSEENMQKMKDIANRYFPDIRFSKKEQWYSPTLKAVQGLKQEKGTGEQMFAMITKTPGVKEAEWKWIGLDDFLKDKKSVTKQEIEDFVRENQVQVEEVERKKFTSPLSEGESDRLEELANLVDRDEATKEERIEYYNLGERVKKEKPAKEAKYSQYTLPGAKNYREVLLTLPNAGKETIEETAKRLYPTEKYNDLPNYQKAQIQKLNELENKGKGFKSSHWDEPNVISHIRLDDRTGPNGEKVLFVEELQSDWSRTAREKGVQLPQSEIDKLEKRRIELEDKGKSATPEEKQEWADIMNRTGGLPTVANEMRVPLQPFLKNWEELVLKRVLRMAAEEGYDRVAWINGEQTAARYDLSKQISNLKYNPETKKLTAFDNDDRAVIDEKVEPEKLGDYIGKDAAKKLIDKIKSDEVPKPNSVGKEFADFFGIKVPSSINLTPADGSMISMLHNDKIRKAVISNFSVDVVNDLKRKQLSGETILGKHPVVSDFLSSDEGLPVLKGVLSAMRKVHTDLRTKLFSGYSAGVDIGLLPTLKASDITSGEMLSLASPVSFHHLGATEGISKLGTATSGTEASFTNNSGKSVTATFADLLDWHGKNIIGNKSIRQEVSIKGENLKVSPQWASALYDHMIPKYLEKYGKKWGAKVEDIDLSEKKVEKGKYEIKKRTDQEEGWIVLKDGKEESYATSEDDAKRIVERLKGNLKYDSEINIQKSIPITPEMRESVMEGQPLFAKGKPEQLEEGIGELPKEPLIQPASGAIRETVSKLKSLHSNISNIAGTYTPFKKSINEWDANNQALVQKVTNTVNHVKKSIKEKERRSAISVYREAGGDEKVLKEWIADTKDPELRKKYEVALTLTPQEKEMADQISTIYKRLYERGVQYGLIDQARKNYVTHLIKSEPGSAGVISKFIGSGKLSPEFKFGKESTFPTIHAAEQAKVKNEKGQPIKFKIQTADAADLLGIYISEMEKTINTKKLIKSLTSAKSKDGRPLAAPAGSIKSTENKKTGNDMLVVFPRTKGKEYFDYKGIDHYALTDWKWAGLDQNGNEVMIKGDLILHPDIYKHMKNLLGHSAIKDWYENPPNIYQKLPAMLIRNLDKWQATTKQAMFSLSAFHWVQEGTHAIGHRVNPFSKIPTIDLEANQKHIDAANHGLRLKSDYVGMNAFREGVGAGALMYKIPGLGPFLEKTSEPLFTWYIPGIKYKTYEHMLERNSKRYAKEIKSGKVSIDDVKYLSAQQANAAYGHLNYTDIGRSQTMQHLFRMFVLAPDFLEARARFVGQAVKGLMGGKVGKEQLEAIAVLAVLQYGACRIYNKLMDDDYHFEEPFKIIIGKRKYSLRSVPGDIVHLVQHPHQFIQGRIAPVIGKSAEHLLYGRDYRGLPQSTVDFLREVATSWMPISFRATIPGMSTNKDINAFDTFLNAIGIGVSRYSPLTHVYKLVDDWREKNNIPKEEAVYAPSRYRDLRNAVEDMAEARVYKEWDKIVKDAEKQKTTKAKLLKGFHQSLFKPFTGSTEGDKKLYRSLNENDKLIYKEARKDRIRVWQNFRKIMAERTTNESPVESPEEPTE